MSCAYSAREEHLASPWEGSFAFSNMGLEAFVLTDALGCLIPGFRMVTANVENPTYDRLLNAVDLILKGACFFLSRLCLNAEAQSPLNRI